MIAQEVEAVLPKVVSKDAQGYKSVDYSRLTALLIEGMKQQQQEEIQYLLDQVKRIDRLESMLTEIQSSQLISIQQEGASSD